MRLTYNEVFLQYNTPAQETQVAEGQATGRQIFVQNNTATDINVLMFRDPNATAIPLQVAVRAGGSIGVPVDFQSFEIYTAQTEPPSDAIPAAGKGGAYDGPGAAGANVTGYISVLAYDTPMGWFVDGTSVNSNASISGALPAGTNNIGHVDVDQMPQTDPSGFTWVKVTAAGAAVEQVKAGAGRVAALVADAGNAAGVNIYLQDGNNQAWNKGDYQGPVPISCVTSIQVNFSAAGSAWVLYK